MDDELGFPFDLEYLNNQRLFLDQDEDAPEEVVVWVESRDDIRLWQRVLCDSKSYVYDFRPASMFRSVDGTAANGCGRLIKLWRSGEIQGGKNSIFCLDSDFKYIAALSDEYSGRDYNIPNFYWTKVHSKEHLFIHEGVVDDLVSHITCLPKKKLGQKAVEVHGWISEVIYSSFVRLLYVLSVGFESPPLSVQEFSGRLDGLLKALLSKPQGIFERDGCMIWDGFVSEISRLTLDLDGYMQGEGLAEGFLRFEQKLCDAGVTKHNIYLFYRGHDWYTLCYGLAKAYLEDFNSSRIAEIKADSKDVARDIGEHKNQTPKVSDAFLALIPCVESVPFFKDTVLLLRHEYPESH